MNVTRLMYILLISTKLTCVATTLSEDGNLSASVNSAKQMPHQTDVYSDLGNSGYPMITSTDATSFETQETTIVYPIVTPDDRGGSSRPNKTGKLGGSSRPNGTQPTGGPSRPNGTQPLGGSVRPNRTQPLGGPSRPDGTQPLGGSARPNGTQTLDGSARPNRTHPLDKSARHKGTPAKSGKRNKVQFTGTENQRKILDNTKYFMDYYYNPIVVIVGLLGKNIL